MLRDRATDRPVALSVDSWPGTAWDSTAAAGLPPERVVDGLCLGAVPIGAAGTDAALDVTRNARITRPLTAPVPQRQRRSAILRSTAALRAGRIGVTRLGGKETAALPATAGQTELPTTIDAAGAEEGIAAQAEADRTAVLLLKQSPPPLQ